MQSTRARLQADRLHLWRPYSKLSTNLDPLSFVPMQTSFSASTAEFRDTSGLTFQMARRLAAAACGSLLLPVELEHAANLRRSSSSSFLLVSMDRTALSWLHGSTKRFKTRLQRWRRGRMASVTTPPHACMRLFVET